MHVREVPGIIFAELAPQPRTINVQAYAQQRWPGAWDTHPGVSDIDRTVGILGADGGCTLRLTDTSLHTQLQVYPTLELALTGGVSDMAGQLVAGIRQPGTWSPDSGAVVEQALWMQPGGREFRTAEHDEQAIVCYGALQQIAIRMASLRSSGVVDVSRYYEDELRLPGERPH
jgi:hypothetical protein